MKKHKIETDGAHLNNDGSLTKWYVYRGKKFSVKQKGKVVGPVYYSSRTDIACSRRDAFKVSSYLYRIGTGKYQPARTFIEARAKALKEINTLI